MKIQNWLRVLLFVVVFFVNTSTAQDEPLGEYFERCKKTEECQWPLVCRYFIGIYPIKFCLGGNPRPPPTAGPPTTAAPAAAPSTPAPVNPTTSTPTGAGIPAFASRIFFDTCTDTNQCRPPLICFKPNIVFRRRCYPPIF